MKALLGIGLLPITHLIGAAIFFGCVSGPMAVLAAPLLGLFGWFCIVPEAIGLAAIFGVYRPKKDQEWWLTLLHGLMWALIGGLVLAALVPKEQNNEMRYYIAGFLAGAGAAAVAFAGVHFIKTSECGRQNKRQQNQQADEI